MSTAVTRIWIMTAIAGCGGTPARTAPPPPAPAQTYDVVAFEPCCCMHGQYGAEPLMPSECTSSGGWCVSFPRPRVVDATATGNVYTCETEDLPGTTSR